jgi:hypothetical protein
LALTVKTIGIGAKLTIKENDWVGPKVVPYEPFSRNRVGRHARHPAPPPLSDDSLAEGMAAKEFATMPPLPDPKKRSAAESGEIGKVRTPRRARKFEPNRRCPDLNGAVRRRARP